MIRSYTVELRPIQSEVSAPPSVFTANRSLYQVLKAGTWTRHNTFTNFYLKRFSVRKLDKFAVELGPLIATQSVVGAANSSK